MKVVVQRVKNASVTVLGKITGKIDEGLLVFAGFTQGDNFETIKYIANKVTNLRVFDDENGVMNLSVKDKGLSILSVSQFTLYADASKGNRPSYVKALNKDEAKVLYDLFNIELSKTGLNIQTGIFKADMQVQLLNDGPITIIIEK